MELKPGCKQTEVGVMPEDWNLQVVGGITTTVASGRSHVNSQFGDYPVYGSTGIIGRSTHCDYEGKAILIARVGANAGKLVVVDGEYGVTDNTIMVKSVSSVCMDYFWRQLEAKRLNTMVFGSGQPLITGTQIKNLVIPLPPTKAEQEAIAEALSDTDALIESLEQLVSKKRHLKQGAMQELLTGKKRLPGFSGEWELKGLGTLAGIQRGASPRPIDNPTWFDENSTIGWVRISDVTKSGMFLRETTQRLSPLGVKSSRPVSRGSLIMSICATIGRPIITEIDTCIHDGFVVFDTPCVDQRFLYYALKSIEGDWSKHGQTGSQMNLNTGLINRTKISVPKDEDEQTAIATILSDMDAEIATIETRLAKTRQLKQGMMHNLLTGRIRLVDSGKLIVESEKQTEMKS